MLEVLARRVEVIPLLDTVEVVARKVEMYNTVGV